MDGLSELPVLYRVALGPKELPPEKGSYLLCFTAANPFTATIGRLGKFDFESGGYVYCGSAFGPGGIKARVGRHFKKRKKKRWHVDYVRPHLSLDRVITAPGEHNECKWSQLLVQADYNNPVPKFGASDCRCFSHFFEVGGKDIVSLLLNEQ